MTTTLHERVMAKTLVSFSALPEAPEWVDVVDGESDYDSDGSRLVYWRKIIDLGMVSLIVEQMLTCQRDGSVQVSPAYFDPYNDGERLYVADECEAFARGLVEAARLIRRARPAPRSR